MNFLFGFLTVMAGSLAATIALIFGVRRLPFANSLRGAALIAPETRLL